MVPCRWQNQRLAGPIWLANDTGFRAENQSEFWEHDTWVTKLSTSIAPDLWESRISPALERLEDSWARDIGIHRDAVVNAAAVGDAGTVDPVALLVASMAWGFGPRGYGPARALKMLNTPGVEQLAAEIYIAARTSPADGFGALFKEGKARINGLSVSMGSKFLYFASWDLGAEQSLITDTILYSNMKSLGISQALNPERFVESSQYAQTVKWMHDTAEALNSYESTPSANGSDVECALFQYKTWKRRKDRRAALGLNGSGSTQDGQRPSGT